MKFALLVLAAIVVAVAAGLATDHVILQHAANGGLYEPQVRLGAATGGLFGGGVAGTLTFVVLFLTVGRGKQPR